MITATRRSLEGSGPDRLYVSAYGMFESELMDPGQRHCGADDDHDDASEDLRTDDSHGVRLREKVKTMVVTTAGVMEAGGSTSPAVRAPASINITSKAVGCRMDLLRTPTVQGGCDQVLQVPGVQQVLAATTMQEGLASASGSMWEATWDQRDVMMRQEETEVCSMENDKSKATKNDLFRIPKRLKDDYKHRLKATSEDFERGTLDELKCKLCPGANFRTWDHFKRHCKTSERHPLRILICDRCGRHFTRPDSLKRHFDNQACKSFPETNHGV
jgi:hypothetical protein